MKREIKFRAWDEGNKVMHFDFQFVKTGDDGNDWILFTSDKQPKFQINEWSANPYFSQQLKIMQYTGLKDCEDAELYDGDIVRTIVRVCINKEEIKDEGYDNFFIVPEYKEEERLCQIDWYDGVRVSGWRLLGKNKRFQTQLKKSTIGNMHIKKVGNIYENPELL